MNRYFVNGTVFNDAESAAKSIMPEWNWAAAAKLMRSFAPGTLVDLGGGKYIIVLLPQKG